MHVGLYLGSLLLAFLHVFITIFSDSKKKSTFRYFLNYFCPIMIFSMHQEIKCKEVLSQKMGQKDISEKILMDYNDVFADIINVLVFHGEKRVNPNDLVNTAVHAQYKAEEGKLHEEERDVIKFWKTAGIKFALLGLEIKQM